MEKYAVILAGGSGTRLWPLSRENRPKQYICIGSEKCILLQTIERLSGVVSTDKCYVATNTSQKIMLMDVLQGFVPPSNTILEPLKKNTAACITYAVLLLKHKYEEGIVCCIPSDSYVKDEEGYKFALETACREAEKNNCMVVIGITPSYPATGYGYIKTGISNSEAKENAFMVQQFTEKPCIEKAREFVANGQFLWNSGIVIGTMDSILNNVRCFLPDLYYKLSEAVNNLADEPQKDSALEKAFLEIENISFDSGVLEKSKEIRVVKGNFGWSDIGCLDALDKVYDIDSMGNSVSGSFLGIEASNNIISSEKCLTAAIGLDDMIIINTGDVVFICPKKRAQEVRVVVELLKQHGYEKYT